MLHGWYQLAPFRWVKAQDTLERVERLSSGKVVLLAITAGAATESIDLYVNIAADSSLLVAERAEIGDKVR